MATLLERMRPYLDDDLELARIGNLPCPALCRASWRARDDRAISEAERRAIGAAVQADRGTGMYLYKCEQFAHLPVPDMHTAHRRWVEKLLVGIDNPHNPCCNLT